MRLIYAAVLLHGVIQLVISEQHAKPVASAQYNRSPFL